MSAPARSSPTRPGPRPVLLAVIGGLLSFGLLAVEAALVLRLKDRFAALTTSQMEASEARVDAMTHAATAYGLVDAAVESRGREDLVSRLVIASDELDRALVRLTTVAVGFSETELATQAQGAAARLRSVRLEAVQLAASGRVVAARTLLEGGVHRDAKIRLDTAIARLDTATTSRLGASLAALDRQAIVVLALCGVSLVFLLAAWWEVVRSIRVQIDALANAANAARLKVAIFESSADAILTVDERSLVLEMNAEAERLLGRAREHSIGRSIDEVLGPATINGEALIGETRQALRDGPISHGDLELRPPHAEPFPAEIVVTRTDLASGQVVQTLILRDRTDRVAAERRRRQLEERLRQSQKMEALGVLAGGVAHDFGNLITAISGAADRARAALPPDHAATASLIELESTARDAGGLTRSLLAFSRKGIADRRPLDLVELVTWTMGLVDRLTPATCRVSLSVDSDRPVWVVADHAQLQQVVINLMLNASDAMPDGGHIRVRIGRGARSAGDAEEGAIIEVSDEGSGVPEELRRRIFEPFFTTKSEGQGVGLGLSVSHGIVIDHGGTIDTRPYSADGATFIVWLPECPPAPASDEKAVRTDAVVGVLEPDAFVRELIGSALERAGYRVRLLSEMAEVREANELTLLVADELPIAGHSGDRPDVGLLILSDNADPAFEVGNAEVLLKPFQMGELLDRVGQMLASEPGSP